MKVFISYHRADNAYRKKTINILNSHHIDFYVVPENKSFNGKSQEEIKTYLCDKLKTCDVLLCLVGTKTYTRPHVDREIHEALKGKVGDRLGIICVFLPTRNDCKTNINLKTFPAKLNENKKYVVLSNWNELNDKILTFVSEAYNRSNNPQLQTKHTNKCMQLRSTIYYDN